MVCAPSGLHDRARCRRRLLRQLAVQEVVQLAQRRRRAGRSVPAHTFHEYTSSGLGSNSLRVLHAGQVGQRAELGGDRHVVVGLGHHRRLAGERVAHEQQLVLSVPIRNVIEAVELVEAALAPPSRDRRLRACATRGSGTPPRCRCRFRTDAERLELAPHHVRIRQRAVVHQAEILAGGERVRVRGRHRRLGGHARVCRPRGCRDLREPVALRDLRRRPCPCRDRCERPTDST